MKGILADNNVTGQVAYLVQLMQSEPWVDFWTELGLILVRFEDAGLAENSTDTAVWLFCQANELVPITDNRNDDSPDSLASTIRRFNTPVSLPVFTIADIDIFGVSRHYEERVLWTLFDYLLRIDEVRGTGRLFLP